MKTLHLIRHAKSSWDEPRLSDHSRPLSKRGLKDSAIMAKALSEADIYLSNVYCSSATRAQQTIQNLSDHWPGQPVTWQTVDALYEFSVVNVINWLEKAFRENNELSLVGHNPALTDLINHLSDSSLDNFPTCAYAQLEFDAIERHGARLNHFLKPKMFK